MGKFDEICKIMSDLDHKYHMDKEPKNEEVKEDALIKHLEEEYHKEQELHNIK